MEPLGTSSPPVISLTSTYLLHCWYRFDHSRMSGYHDCPDNATQILLLFLQFASFCLALPPVSPKTLLLLENGFSNRRHIHSAHLCWLFQGRITKNKVSSFLFWTLFQLLSCADKIQKSVLFFPKIRESWWELLDQEVKSSKSVLLNMFQSEHDVLHHLTFEDSPTISG